MWRGLVLAAAILTLGSVDVGRLASAGDAPPSPQPALPAPAKTELPRHRVDLGGGVFFEMVLIPAGEFDMGSPETEEGREQYETLHRVRITKPYWLATTEVTQAAWERVTRANPSRTKGPTLPVTHVSWDDCQAFVKRLSENVAGGGFRLPTEAEWEYACRAGSQTRFCFGDDERTLGKYAWYRDSSGKAAHAVGVLLPNAWGLQDMHGNLWEMCEDWYEEYPNPGDGVVSDPVAREWGYVRVCRGGGWNCPGVILGSALRATVPTTSRRATVGFRLARTVTSDAPPPRAAGNAPPAPPAPPPAPAAEPPRGPAPPPPPSGPPPPSASEPREPAHPVAPPTREGEIPSWAKVAPEQLEAAKKAGVLVAFENSIGMRFVLIPGGTFTMGSPETEEGRAADETQHEVTLTRPYYLGVTEVTNAQYRRFKGDHDSGTHKGLSLNGDDQPVVEVSWDEATVFVGRLNAQDLGRTYRLPTEAELERACRAGTSTARYWGEGVVGAVLSANVTTEAARVRLWPNKSSWPVFPGEDGFVVASPVGRLRANAYGLHDMLGNVWEFCADGYEDYSKGRVTDPAGPSSGSVRVLRGGSWDNLPEGVRASRRARVVPGGRAYIYGFRVAVSVAPR